jgi:hypothetical protein
MKKDKQPVEIAEPVEVVVEPDPESDLPFILGTWKGLPQWQCRFCAWDTLEGEDVMMEHYIARHAPAPTFVSSEIVVYDRWGKPVR